MRVLLVSNMYPSRSEPAFGPFIRDQVLQLRRLGVTVDLAVNTNRRTGLRHVGPKYAALAARAVGRAFSARYDVVHAHYLFPPGAIGAAIATLRRTPLVVTCHGSDVLIGDRASWVRTAAGAALRAADAVIAVSEEGRQGLSARYRMASHRIEVIDMGVAVERFDVDPGRRTETRARMGADGEPVFISLAHLIPRKNVVAAVEATARIPGVRLVIAGDGPERGALEARASELGVRERVAFLGAVRPDEVPALLTSADAFVLPSLYEGRPIALLEAMAARLPSVAAAVGGTPEVVRDGENGFLVDPRDIDGLTAAMQRAIGPDAPRISANAHATALAHDVRESARRVAAIYGRVAGARRSGRT